MDAINFDYHPQFFTATILEWKHLLKDDSYKDIIINSLQFFKNEKSIVIYGYVPNVRDAKPYPPDLADTGRF